MNPVSVENSGNIAIVKINNPPVNALSHAVREGLMAAVEKIDADNCVDAVVLWCEGRTFIAGADIKEFGKPISEPHLPDVIARIETSNKPWIAALHGTALGGGFEVALGCHYRICAENGKVGLPEVHLGLMPGAGGTVRLPRLIGVKEAVEIVSGGKPINARRALELGIVSEVANLENLMDVAMKFAGKINSSALPSALWKCEPKENLSPTDWQELINNIEKKSRGQLSPVEAAKAIQEACSVNGEEAFLRERQRFIKLRDSEQSKALRYVFFAERQTAKVERIDKAKAKTISRCGVLGGGTMGAGIVATMLLSGKSVILVEQDMDGLAAGTQRVQKILAASLKRGLITREKHELLLSALSGSIHYDAFSDCELVIEAVYEDMDVKQAVFSKIEKVVNPDAVLATNTSYLDINEIAQELDHPARLVGLHFFSPAHIMKLVEVIETRFVSDDVLASAIGFAKSLRKVPVLSGVCEGFIGNRIMSAYRKECDYMLEDGCLPAQIDKAMKEFGLPMGMYEMADMAGLDIGWATRKRLAPTRDPNERYVRIADRLCELGRLGQKTGSGWYQYSEDSRVAQPDDLVSAIIEEESALKQITRRSFDHAEIMARILAAMTKEAQSILDEGIAQRASDIDMVMILGYGFPRWRGGPMFMAD